MGRWTLIARTILFGIPFWSTFETVWAEPTAIPNMPGEPLMVGPQANVLNLHCVHRPSRSRRAVLFARVRRSAS
eukprot:8680033-Pyramimonas_sp.AAC.1